MTSGEFVCLVNDSPVGYRLSTISYTAPMQSNEQKQWLKAKNEENNWQTCLQNSLNLFDLK